MNLLLSYLSILAFPMFFGIGMGPSSQENQQYGALSGIGKFGTSAGEADISAANNFWTSILSGDPGKISQVLGPAISGINKRGQEEKKTLGEFGNRSGGTNAEAQSIDDTTRGAVTTMTSDLTGKAGSELGSLGTGLLNTGLSATSSAFDAAKVLHDQNQAKMNDIFKSIASVAAAIPTGGMSLGGLAGGGGGMPSFGGGGGGGSDFSDFGSMDSGMMGDVGGDVAA